MHLVLTSSRWVTVGMCRWFARHRDEWQSVGAVKGEEQHELWRQHQQGVVRRADGRRVRFPLEWAPVQTIVRRFIYAPFDHQPSSPTPVPQPGHGSSTRRQPPAAHPLHLFRTCPLPVPMRL